MIIDQQRESRPKRKLKMKSRRGYEGRFEKSVRTNEAKQHQFSS